MFGCEAGALAGVQLCEPRKLATGNIDLHVMYSCEIHIYEIHYMYDYEKLLDINISNPLLQDFLSAVELEEKKLAKKKTAATSDEAKNKTK